MNAVRRVERGHAMDQEGVARVVAALVEIAQEEPLPVGCACWAEVASFYQEALRQRIERARAALPAALRPASREERRVQTKVEWVLAGGRGSADPQDVGCG